MGRAARFTEAEIKRALKAARADNPKNVVEIRGGVIRILPPEEGERASTPRDEVNEWFENNG